MQQRSVQDEEELYEENFADSYDIDKKEEEMIYHELMAGLGTFNLKVEKYQSP